MLAGWSAVTLVGGEVAEADPAVLVASSDKIRKELKWKPKYPQLDQIVSTAWEWMQTHPHGYAELTTTKSH